VPRTCISHVRQCVLKPLHQRISMGALPHTATHCNTKLYTATQSVCIAASAPETRHGCSATHRNTLQYTAIHCNTVSVHRSLCTRDWPCNPICMTRYFGDSKNKNTFVKIIQTSSFSSQTSRITCKSPICSQNKQESATHWASLPYFPMSVSCP